MAAQDAGIGAVMRSLGADVSEIDPHAHPVDRAYLRSFVVAQLAWIAAFTFGAAVACP